MFAARVHGGASVSSPTLRFYQPGTALQVVGRENGWVKVEDPTSRQSGWVFEQYLASTEDPTLRRTAMATTGGDSLSKPKLVKPTLITKKRNRSSRPPLARHMTSQWRSSTSGIANGINTLVDGVV